MKDFAVYQVLDGEILTDRDPAEINSKFWNRGKWDNFVAPLISEDCIPHKNCAYRRSEMTLVDMGCNAGLFLKYAKDLGFKKAIGVDSNREAIGRGSTWRDKHGLDYELRCEPMETCLDSLPVADYTILANAHYYFYIADWLNYLDKLQYKTRYCIVVTTEKRNAQVSIASADLGAIRNYFKGWKEVGFIDALPTEGDPSPRKLYGLCFQSPHLDRVPIESLDCGNHVQDKFYRELEAGKDYHQTKYYRILKGYRKKWTEAQLDEFALGKMALFESVKTHGQLRPIIVGENNRVLDGNHLYSMLKHLGDTSVLIRRT